MRLIAGYEMKIAAARFTPFIAMLRPRSGGAQWVVSESYETDPFAPGTEYVDTFGNLCQRLSAPAKHFALRTEAVMEVSPTLCIDRSASLTAPAELPDAALQFLLPSRYCPSDKMIELAEQIAGKSRPGYRQVEAFVNYIRENIEYKYGVSDGFSSALDTLGDGAGVCRDYSHVGMALCRAIRIPARMVVGYLYQLEPMDLHAWFEAYVGGRWYTFDATQDSPKGGRIAVAYGRDAADVALVTELGELKMESMKVWVERK